MDRTEFTQRLHEMSDRDFEDVAAALHAELDSVDGEVAWWRATMAVTGTLRRHHLTRTASLAAHDASQAVVAAARRNGVIDARRDDVTAVARAASEAVRALIATDPGILEPAVTAPLLAPWVVAA